MYFEALDIIRLLGFVWVFLHHIQVPVLFIKENGWIGMDLLFALSGFLIAKPVASYKNYLVKRILRIWPLYFLYLLLIGNFSQTWPYMLFAGNWQVMFHGWSSFVLVGHLWAVSMQEQVYVIYPWILKFWPVALLLSILLKFVFFDPNNYYSIYMNTLVRLEPFILGSLVAMYKDKVSQFISLPVFVLGLISFNFVNIRESQNVWLVIIGYLFVAVWCASTLLILLKIKNFKLKIVSKLAGLGFGLYIWHKVAMEITHNNLVLAFVVTVALAYISYHVYEKNFRH